MVTVLTVDVLMVAGLMVAGLMVAGLTVAGLPRRRRFPGPATLLRRSLAACRCGAEFPLP